MKKSPAVLAAQCIVMETAAAFTSALGYHASLAGQRLWRRAGALNAEVDAEGGVTFTFGDVSLADEGDVERLLAGVDPLGGQILKFPNPRSPRDEHPAGRGGQFDDDPSA